jgi:hypothetical protein
LLPVNPALERVYLANYRITYDEDPPTPRLTINEVIDFESLPAQIPQNALFAGYADQVLRTSAQRGMLVITDSKQMRFCQRNYETIISLKLVADVKWIKLVDYHHKPHGVMVEDVHSDSFLFAFDASSQRDAFASVLESIGVRLQRELNRGDLLAVQTQWTEGNLSNFEYLVYLNLYSGRTWTDFAHFPVFPWTLVSFKDRLDVNDASSYRDLSWPLFAQTPKQREICTEYYHDTSEMGQPHHFPNFISHIGSTLYYLVRLEPFTNEVIEFQSGSLDAADRTFQSLQISAELMRSWQGKNALELVPEVYFLPELFLNVNKIVFPTSPINRRNISLVALPPWATSAHDAVCGLRQALESDVVSNCLHEWIDLVWGVRQRGKQAEERMNCMMPIVFEYHPEELMEDSLLLKAADDQVRNCGQGPTQLFVQAHPKRRLLEGRKISLSFHVNRRSERSEPEWLVLNNHVRVRLNRAGLEFWPQGEPSVLIGMSGHLQPTCIAVSGNNFVTGHLIPVVQHWIGTSGGVRPIGTLKGHIAVITSVHVHAPSELVLSGHEDGVVSVFVTHPHQFVRVISCFQRLPIVRLKMIVCRADILIMQEIPGGVVMTMWTVNGSFVEAQGFSFMIRDWAVTAFDDGTRKNVIVVLTRDAELKVIDARSLRVKQTIVCDGSVADGVLSIWKNRIVFLENAKHLLGFQINFH